MFWADEGCRKTNGGRVDGVFDVRAERLDALLALVSLVSFCLALAGRDAFRVKRLNLHIQPTQFGVVGALVQIALVVLIGQNLELELSV